jgi:hypothetical protein
VGAGQFPFKGCAGFVKSPLALQKQCSLMVLIWQFRHGDHGTVERSVRFRQSTLITQQRHLAERCKRVVWRKRFAGGERRERLLNACAGCENLPQHEKAFGIAGV